MESNRQRVETEELEVESDMLVVLSKEPEVESE